MQGKAILAVILTAAFATGAAAPAVAVKVKADDDLYLHIKVHEGEQGDQITVTLPVSFVRKASALIPGHVEASGRIMVNDEEITVAELRQLWRELRRKPDATYVTLDDDGDRVRVAKRGGYLVLEATDGEEAEVRIPAPVVDALLSGKGDRFDLAAAIAALARHGEGELVTVTGDGDSVRVWIDDRSDIR
jgi:hypothetical protein